MGTIIDDLKQKKTLECISKISTYEAMAPQELIQNIIDGYVVVPWNNLRTNTASIAIGKGTTIKINANIGTSPKVCDFDIEMNKAHIATINGTDTLMDLSISGDVGSLKKRLINEIPNIPLGTVPIYETMMQFDNVKQLNIDNFLKIMEKQANEKVDFMTIHAGLLKSHIPDLEKRVLGVVSRGGSILVDWMRQYQKENFLYEYFDDILKIAQKYDITMSLGDGLRPGCTADANDKAQFGELETLGELVQRCRDANVQVMVEGPGHVPFDLIEENIKKEKEICKGAPFYVLGPLVIDFAAGYDHIAGAIGGAMAAFYGADYLCYVTPAEHLRLPTQDDVKEGVIASKIAAYAIDLVRKNKKAIQRNLNMSLARNNFDWDKQKLYSIDPQKFCNYLEKVNSGQSDDPTSACSMCGQWCAIKRSQGKLSTTTT